MKRWLQVIAASLILAMPVSYAISDYNMTAGSGLVVFAFTCFTTKICPATVPVNSSGTEIGTSANPITVTGVGIAPGATFSTQTQSIVGGVVGTLPPTTYTANQVQPVSQTVDGGLRVAPTAPTATTMQNGATGTGVGTVMNVQGYSSVVLTLNCSVSCTTVTVAFQVSQDGTNFGSQTCDLASSSASSGGYTSSNTKATSVTVNGTGFSYYVCRLSGPWLQFRANITARSAGTISIVGYPTTDPGTPRTIVNMPYALPENSLNPVPTAAITDTTSTQVITPAGGGIRNYVTYCKVTNGHATQGTYVQILDGSTVVDSGFAAANGGGFVTRYDPAIVGTANTALNCQATTTASNFKCACGGYKGP